MLIEHAICTSCANVFDIEKINGEYDYTERQIVYKCPNVACANKLIQCDDLIMPAVYLLNCKGYKTYWSCSGHYGESVSSTYVTFAVPHDTVLERTILEIIQSDYNGIEFYCNLDIRKFDEDEEKYVLEPYDGYIFKPDSDVTEVTSRIDKAADDIMNGKDICISVYLYEDSSTPKTYKYTMGHKDFLIDVNNSLYEIIRRFPSDYAIIK